MEPLFNDYEKIILFATLGEDIFSVDEVRFTDDGFFTLYFFFIDTDKARRASPLEDMMAVLSAKKSTMEIPAFKSAAAISYWGTPSNTDRKVFSSIFLKVSEVAFPKRIWEASRASACGPTGSLTATLPRPL